MKSPLSIDKKGIINRVLPEYKKISEAPTTCPDEVSERGEQAEAAWFREERDRRYKAVDADGNVWLVQNPITWPRVVSKFYQDGAYRPAPRAMVLTYEKAVLQAESTPMVMPMTRRQERDLFKGVA